MDSAKGVCCIDENVGLSPLQRIIIWKFGIIISPATDKGALLPTIDFGGHPLGRNLCWWEDHSSCENLRQEKVIHYVRTKKLHQKKTTHYANIYTEKDHSLCEFTSQKRRFTTREITTEDTYSCVRIYFKKKATQRKLQQKDLLTLHTSLSSQQCGLLSSFITFF